MSEPNGTPPTRRLRNYLLDVRFQLKHTLYTVAATLVTVVLLGAFLWRTTLTLFDMAQVAVEARSRAAQASKELGAAALSNELLKRINDPSFATQLRERSRAIDQAYEAEARAISDQRAALVREQKLALLVLMGTLAGFILFIAIASIIWTHRIVGPMFRVKKMLQAVAEGHLPVVTEGLRPGDELRDVFEAMASMIAALRRHEEDELLRIQGALRLAQGERADQELRVLLAELEGRLHAKLDLASRA